VAVAADTAMTTTSRSKANERLRKDTPQKMSEKKDFSTAGMEQRRAKLG
jgi:hypothetical protein